MLPPEFFLQFGLYVDPGFVPPELCARLRREMLAGAHEPATVLRPHAVVE